MQLTIVFQVKNQADALNIAMMINRVSLNSNDGYEVNRLVDALKGAPVLSIHTGPIEVLKQQ